MLTIDELEAMGRQLRYLELRSAEGGGELVAEISRHNRLVEDARAQLRRASDDGAEISEGAEMELRFCVAFLARQARHLLCHHGRAVAEAHPV